MRRAPSAIGGSRWLRGCVATLLLTSAALLGAQSVAAAMTSLSSVVLSQTLPGMVAAPPGVRNGPINESNIGLVTGGSSSFEATQFGQLLASGNVNGYVRSWVHEPVNGDAVVICAFQFLDPGQAASFVSGAVPQQDGATSFAVPNVPRRRECPSPRMPWPSTRVAPTSWWSPSPSRAISTPAMRRPWPASSGPTSRRRPTGTRSFAPSSDLGGFFSVSPSSSWPEGAATRPR